jgi:hypothetical protein
MTPALSQPSMADHPLVRECLKAHGFETTDKRQFSNGRATVQFVRTTLTRLCLRPTRLVGSSNVGCLVGLRQSLVSHKTSSIMRRLYIDIASQQLRELPTGERDHILSNLYQRYQKSNAPEFRLALGEIIGRGVIGDVPTSDSVPFYP